MFSIEACLSIIHGKIFTNTDEILRLYGIIFAELGDIDIRTQENGFIASEYLKRLHPELNGMIISLDSKEEAKKDIEFFGELFGDKYDVKPMSFETYSEIKRTIMKNRRR